MKKEMYMTQGAVMTGLLKYSPFEVQRRVFEESILKRGGFIPTPVPTPYTRQRTLDGHAVQIASEDGMAPYRHTYVASKEAWTTGYIGFYFSLKFPLKDEVNRDLITLQEMGIMIKVMSYLGPV